MARVVLVTGVSRYLGGRLARQLGEHPDVDRVVGVDVIPPPNDIGNAEFVRADIRNPVIAKVIKAAAVDTVVHMNVIATPVHASGRSAMKEINVTPKVTELTKVSLFDGSFHAADPEKYARSFPVHNLV